jgi:hypothetical protein
VANGTARLTATAAISTVPVNTAAIPKLRESGSQA